MAITRREFVRLTAAGVTADLVAGAPGRRAGAATAPLRLKAVAGVGHGNGTMDNGR